jgi:hypothetical protein
MSLTFLTPLMLAGAALVAAPIILHLVMRQQPKHLLFPALRFVQLRNDATKRRLKLRHLLLLLLRCGAIVFLALAMARPSLQSAGLLGDQEAPIAAALVVDTSPRMQYKQQNQTRVEVAQDVANRVITQLPAESEVALIDSKTTNPAFSIDVAVARQRVSRLKPAASVRQLPELCADALRLVNESTKARKEIYIFTDLSRAGWTGEAVNQFRKQLAEKPEVACYVIDVGVLEPKNVALADLRLSAESLAKNTPLRLESDVAVAGVTEDQTVALDLLDANGQPQRRGQTTVQTTPGQQQLVDLPIAGLEQGTHQGTFRIIGEDGLPADDVRYFTVDVRTPWKVLVAAPRPASQRAVFLTEAIAPTPFRKTGQSRFETEAASFDELANKSLDDYAAVFLLDPPPLSDAAWQSLLGYTERGGGVGIFLGRNAQPKGRSVDDFNTAAALALLPGKLVRQWHRQDAFLSPSDYQHPLLSIFRSATGGVPWADFPVFSHWQFGDTARGVNTVAPFSNGEAAILERNIGKGRVVVMTTPISDLVSSSEANLPDDEKMWNLLTVGSGPWPFMMLANGASLYLVGSGEERFNYQAGETVVLRLPEEQRQLIFSLRTPEGEEFPQSVDQKSGTITITTTTAIGNYMLRAGGSEKGVRRGFSVNVPAAETDLTRLPREEFAELLGKDRFKLSRGRDEIERDVSVGRTGREMYPLLIFLVAVALGLESVLANKFYRRDPKADLKEEEKSLAVEATPAVSPQSASANQQREPTAAV